MQDNKLLGDNAASKSTVNATTDMSQGESSGYRLPANFKFVDPNAKAPDYTATLGDTAKAFGSGALRGIAGIGELAENTLGVGESLRDVANSGADFVEESMTPEGRETLNARLFEENENGNPVFADGAGDIDVWAMKIANGLGSLVPNLAAGGGAGAAAKVALRGTVIRSMVKKGATEQVAAAVADKTIARIGSAAAMTTGVGSSLGGASMDAYDSVMQMDSSTLADQSPYFQNTLLRLADEPDNEGLSATELFEKAKDETARYASAQMSTDPTAIAASVAGAMGDKFLFDALLGKMGKGVVSGAVKGAASEGGTEFMEGYGQTVAQNQVMNDVAGTDVDPTSGAMANALEGAAVGMGTGAPLGAAGGALSRLRNRGNQIETPEGTATDTDQMAPEEDVEPGAPAEEPQTQPEQEKFNQVSPDSVSEDGVQVDGREPQSEPPTPDQLREAAAARQADNERQAAVSSNFQETRENLLGALQRDGRPVNQSLSRSALTANQADRDMIALARSVDTERTDQLLDTIATGTDAEAEGAYGELDMMAIRAEESGATAQDSIVNRALEGNRKSPTEEQRTVQQIYRDAEAGVIDNPRTARANLEIDRLANQAYQSARSLNTGPWGTRQEPEGWNRRQELPTEAWQRRQDEQASAGLEQERRDDDFEPARAQQRANDQRQEDIDSRRSALGQTGNRLDQLSTAETNAQGRRTPEQIERLQRENKERELERTFFPQPLGQEGISKRLRRKLRRSKGFDSDAVLEELRNNEQRLRAYAQNGVLLSGESLNDAVADLAARFNQQRDRRQDNTREKAAEILERMQSRPATEFKQNLISQSIRRINQVIDRAPGETVEIDGQQVSKQEAKTQMAGSVRSLANKFLGKTAALNERTRQRRAENTIETVNERQRDQRQGEPADNGLIQTAVADVVPGVEHLGQNTAPNEPQMSPLNSEDYEMVASGRNEQMMNSSEAVGDQVNGVTPENDSLDKSGSEPEEQGSSTEKVSNNKQASEAGGSKQSPSVQDESAEAELYGSGPVMFSRSPVSRGEEGNSVGKPRVNRGLVEVWAANVIRNNPVISSAGQLIRVVSSESDLPQHIQREIEADGSQDTIQGVFDGEHVYIIASKHNNQDSVEQVLLHELAGHYGLRKLFGHNIEAELSDIRSRLGGKRGILKLAKKHSINIEHYATDYDNRVSNGSISQSMADDLLFDELLAHVSQMPRLAKPLERIWQKARRLLHKLGFTKTAGYTNADLLDLVQDIRTNLVKFPDNGSKGGRISTTPMFKRSAPSKIMSVDEALEQKQNKLLKKIKQALYSTPVAGQTLDAIGRNKYAMLTLRQMGEVAHRIEKQLGTMIDGYLGEINSMVVTQNMLAEQAATIAEDLSDWAKANAKDADVLFSLAHEATLADVDPSEAFQSREAELEESIAKQERILKEEGGLNSERGSKAFNTLKEERELLKQEPHRRKRHAELRPKFARLNKEQKARYRQMRDHYREQNERMNKALEENIIRAVQDAKIRKAMLAELRQRNERAAKGLYFPLSRHGDYWIDFADQNGERQFMMFETKGEMELAAEKLTGAGFEINSGMKAQTNAVQKASLPFVADVIQLVDQAHISDPMKQSLGDEIYQMYLRTLPARSMRRNFIHRKGVAGFSQDAVRALAEQGFKQSRQQARLDHMDILDNHLDAIQKLVGELPNNVEADRMVEELNKRHDWVRNPARSGWAQKLTSLGFVWMLGATPAAALVNLSQNLQVALPILGSRHTFAAASKEMLQASGEFLRAATKKGPAGQGVLSRTLTGSEKEALRRAIDQGVIDVTQAADLAGLAENPNAKYSGTWNKWMNRIGWMFHQAEVFNREVTFLAAYRLEKQKHGDHERAINQAIKDTWDSHFDYSSINRARFMQSDMAAVALQFKQYSQNMSYYLWSNLEKSIKGESPEVKSMARKQLLGTLATTFFVGGAGALPLWALTQAINAAQGIFGDDDEPFDAETEMKAMLAGAFGKEWAATIWHGTLPSIGGRISLNDLWVRSINRDVDADDAYMEYMKQALGPVLGGIGVSWAQGVSDISNDNWARGIERLPPKAVRDMLKTARFINEEGITTRAGAEVVDDLTYPELAGQMFGFAVGRANVQYDENNAIKNYEQHVVKRRQSLMNAYYSATRLKDGEAMREVMEKIKRYNRSQYGRLNPITTKGLRQSIRTRQRNLANSQNGIQVNPKLQTLVREYDFF